MENEKNRSIFLAEEAVRAYPALKAEYQRLKYSVNAGHDDPTATAALRELPFEEQRQYEAVQKAIRKAISLRDGGERLMVIRLHYLEDHLSPSEIAEKLDIPVEAVKRNCADFIRTVKELLNVSDCEGCYYFRIFTGHAKACFYCLDTGQLRLQGVADGRRPCPHYLKREVMPSDKLSSL